MIFFMALPFVFLLSLAIFGVPEKQEAIDDFLYDHPKSGVAIWAGAIVILCYTIYQFGWTVSRWTS